MKKIILILSCLFPLLATAQLSLNVKGKSDRQLNKTLLFFYEKGAARHRLLDSCRLQADGTFNKQLNVKSPGMYLAGFSETELTPFWADGEDVEIIFSKESPAVLKGGINNELMNIINRNSDEYIKMMSSSDPKFDRRKAILAHKEALTSLAKKYAEVPAIICVLTAFDFNADASFLNEVSATLLKANPDNPAVKNYVFDITRLNVGQPATDVTYLTTEGERQSLKSILGHAKYTLVDFWGTYCVPCREGIPGIKKLYAEYHSKGFDVLAISLDTKDEMWKKSLSEEAMPWPQGRTEDGGRKAMLDYRFTGIPFLALFDQKGNIVALGLPHEDLEKKLAELMGQPDFVKAEIHDENTPNRSPKEEALISEILLASTLKDYSSFFKDLKEEEYKVKYLKTLAEQLQPKAYQLSKLGWSLGNYYKDYIKILGTRGLSDKKKLEELHAVDSKLISFVRFIFGKAKYEQYLALRIQKKLSY